jgi:hypothetical protein
LGEVAPAVQLDPAAYQRHALADPKYALNGTPQWSHLPLDVRRAAISVDLMHAEEDLVTA